MPEPSNDHESRVRLAARNTARAEVHSFFAKLGVDPKDDREIKALAEGFQWLKERDVRERRRKKVIWMLVVAMGSSAVGKAVELLLSAKGLLK